MAPVFCFALAGAVLLWTQRNRYHTGDCAQGNRAGFFRKTFFWLTVLAAIPVILSIVLSMVPLFGTTGQEFLYHLHQYSALTFLVSAIMLAGLTKSTVTPNITN